VVSDIVRDGVSWPTVEAAVLSRIEELHLMLESAPQERVPVYQGQITGLRWLLSHAQPRPPLLTAPVE